MKADAADTGALPQARRCGAKTRSGAPCKSAPVKHGRYTKEVQATRRWLREATQLLRSFR